jgi:two-component system chemotaxis response regulator CheB
MIPAYAPAAAEAVRVMVVDDSAVARGLVGRWLSEQPGLSVVASCRTGKDALDQVAATRPDVVVLDVEMPDMDGLTALPLLLQARPGLAVVMASSLTSRGADITLRCLALGATDFLAKPKSSAAGAADYRRDLVEKVLHLGESVRRRSPGRAAAPRAFAAAPEARPVRQAAPSAPAIKLRPFSPSSVRAIAIGSSTGGPQALLTMLRAAAPALTNVPVLVTQHMPPAFTAALADHLAHATGLPAREAGHGEKLARGVIYVAPGGKHLSIARSGAEAVARLDDGPSINYCKPSVDPLFISAAAQYGAGLLAVVLTGMGADGAGGVRAVAAAGGSIIAQDEASSVVWGMPGAAAATGCCSAVLPLPAIGPKLTRLLAGDRL